MHYAHHVNHVNRSPPAHPFTHPFSPLMDRKGGLAIVGLFCWFLGLCTTLAEPSLQQLGITTEELTRGNFRKALVVGSVAGGVSVGVMMGALKLVLDAPSALFFMIYTGYALALALTFVSTDEFVCVAWDCAGGATGAVTAPFVLAVGLGIGLAIGSKDAFGLLAMASVMPILSVLCTGLVLTAIAKRRTRHDAVSHAISEASSKIAVAAAAAKTERMRSGSKPALTFNNALNAEHLLDETNLAEPITTAPRLR
jgi:hypothetical protein